jgi:hypothetical protein
MTRVTLFALFSLFVSTFAFSQEPWPAKSLNRDEPLDVRNGSGFGAGAALSRGRAMVGAPYEDGHGAVYVYEQHGADWVQTQKLFARDMGPGHFGASIVFKSNTALISDNDRNLVYAFDFINGSFRITAILRGGVELFGSAMALEGCVALISSGADFRATQHGWVHVYNRCPDGKWVWKGSFASPDASPADFFGMSLALKGNDLLVGAPGTANNAGAAYRYAYANGQWHFKQKLMQANPHGGSLGYAGGNLFGAGVGFSNGLAAIGAPNTLKEAAEGEVSLFKLVNGSWAPSGILDPPDIPGSGVTSNIGYKIIVTDDRVYINSLSRDYYRTGTALDVFRRTGDTLQFEKQWGPNGWGDDVGVAFDVDGRGLIVGDPTVEDDWPTPRPGPLPKVGSARIYQVPSP